MGMKFSQLTAGAALSGTEVIPMVQSSLNYKTTPAAILTYALAQTLNTFTGTLKANTGGVFVGQLGSYATARTDAQIEIRNTTGGQHALFSIYNSDYTDEGSISWATDSSTTTGQQVAAAFVRMVGGVNTAATYKGVWGVHVVGGATDNTQLLVYSNNAMKLLPGTSASTPWSTAPVTDTIQIGTGTTTRAGVQIALGLVSGWCGIGAQNLTLSSSNYALLVKNDGTATQLNAVTGGAVNQCINNTVVTAVTSGGLTTTGSMVASTSLTAFNATGTPAGGTTGTGIFFGSAGVSITWGSSAPTLTAVRGSLYIRTDNGANTSLYINRDGGTTWAAVTSA